ncbi:hypothetical protein MMC17_008770 [Xylographa soralifera]|nr:hypothetical protein [Xylographa soralifera]
MSADRLVSQALKSSKVGMLGRLQAAPPDQRIVLLRFLLVDISEVRISTLKNNGNPDFAVFNTSIFAPTPSADDEARSGTIGNSVLREAAQIFYGENQFVCDDLDDLVWFATRIEPSCHKFVRTLILSDGAFPVPPAAQNRDENHLCTHDYQMITALRYFTGLQHLIFTFTWDLPSVNIDPYGYILVSFCQPTVLPSLRDIIINRTTREPPSLTPASRTEILANDSRLVHHVNSTVLRPRTQVFQPMEC